MAQWGAEFKVLAHVIASGDDVNAGGYSSTFFSGYEMDVFNKPPWWRRRLF